MADKTKICLWFDGSAQDAARFYCDLLPDSRIDQVQTAPADYPGGKAGDVLTVEFTMAGRAYLALNGRKEAGFTDAFSVQVFCDTQAEIDRLWDAIIADGGAASQCGWCRDRWGLSWQILPHALTAAMSDPAPGVAQRVFGAMMGMIRIDVAAIEAARAG